MHFSLLIPLLPLVAATSIPAQPQHIITNPSEQDVSSFKIPTRFESAVIARRVLHLTPHGTLSTIFPSPHSQNQDESSSPSALENRPSGLQGMPIGLTDYIADCEPKTGNPTILAINIATSFKNVAAGSNISLSVQWTPPYPPKSRIESTFTSASGARTEFSAANLPRFSLLGYLEKIPQEEVEVLELGKCFTNTHPDAKYWLPGNRIHASEWVRLVVQDVYFIGGFGDRAYIGWIPVEEWKNVTSEMVDDIRLPGEEKGWKEWAVDSMGSIWEL